MTLVAACRDDSLRAQAKLERADKRRRGRSGLKACKAGVL